MKIVIFFIAINLISASFMKAQDTTGTGALAQKFLTLIGDFEYDKAIELMDTNVTGGSKKETINKVLQYRQQMFGSINSWKQYQSGIITKDGETRYTFRYNLQCVKGTSYDRIDIIRRGNELKIIDYRFGTKDSAIDKN